MAQRGRRLDDPVSGDPRGVLLWNAFPWHPHAARGPLSNRTPERKLLTANLHVLAELLAAREGRG